MGTRLQSISILRAWLANVLRPLKPQHSTNVRRRIKYIATLRTHNLSMEPFVNDDLQRQENDTATGFFAMRAKTKATGETTINLSDLSLQQVDIDGMVERWVEDAWQARRESTPAQWRSCVDDMRADALFKFAHLDPFTRHAYSRPRGYPGDAELLDYIYRKRDASAAITAEGADIMRFTVNSPAPRAVRYRRKFLAQLIDETAASHSGARILSIAAGHLREVELSTALRDGRIGEIIAFDQDAESLKVIECDYGHLPIRTLQGNVRHLLAGKTGMGHFHLVYAAGLFDYLDDSVATRLVERMWAMAHPGGRVMIANFLPDIPDAGYMEAFMDWWLIYREERQVRALFSTIPPAQIAELKVDFDPGRNICFIVARKA